jgi:hypothetical protein
MIGLDPIHKKLEKTKIIEVGLDLGLKPSQSNFLWVKGVFGKTHPFLLSL